MHRSSCPSFGTRSCEKGDKDNFWLRFDGIPNLRSDYSDYGTVKGRVMFDGDPGLVENATFRENDEYLDIVYDAWLVSKLPKHHTMKISLPWYGGAQGHVTFNILGSHLILADARKECANPG